MVGDPTATPVTCTGVAVVVAPAGMVTEAGLTVALVVSLLERLTVRPPAGAAVDNVTVRGAD